jgi:hypothetical protein
MPEQKKKHERLWEVNLTTDPASGLTTTTLTPAQRVQIAKLKSLLLKSHLADERPLYQKAYTAASLGLGELLLLPETKAPDDADAEAEA